MILEYGRMLQLPVGTIDINVIETTIGTTDEDWSGCRSPSRARRRAKQGHPQRMRLVPKRSAVAIDDGMTLLIHPETARQLRLEMQRWHDRIAEAVFNGA